MIWTALTAARAFLSRIPWPVWLALAVIVTAILWGNHRYSQGVADTEAKHAAIAAQALTKARKADAAAQDTVTAETGAVEASNDKAREAAAANPDDPLKAGLDELAKGGSH